VKPKSQETSGKIDLFNTPLANLLNPKQKRGVDTRRLKRRNAVEPIIGHLKNDGLLGRNYRRVSWAMSCMPSSVVLAITSI
jgi:hypothetical protein